MIGIYNDCGLQNMSLLPMYDELTSTTPVDIDWKKLCSTINTLPEEHLENISVLIHHHGYITGDKATVPYAGKTMSAGIGEIYTVSKLPELLQRVIFEYVRRVTSG